MTRKTYQIRVDEETKSQLDQYRGRLSYNQYLKSVSRDAATLERYRTIVPVLKAVDGESWRWKSALEDIVRKIKQLE